MESNKDLSCPARFQKAEKNDFQSLTTWTPKMDLPQLFPRVCPYISCHSLNIIHPIYLVNKNVQHPFRRRLIGTFPSCYIMCSHLRIAPQIDRDRLSAKLTTPWLSNPQLTKRVGMAYALRRSSPSWKRAF